MRLVNGMLAAAVTLGVLATGMGVVNYTTRSWAGRRLMENHDDLTAEALLLLF